MGSIQAAASSVSRRLSRTGGFGLVELLIAMTILTIGLSAIMATFESGVIATRRASRTLTATALAASQLELYRALTYSVIALDQTAVNATDSTYRADPALGGSIGNDITTSTGCSGLPNQCNPSFTATGADGGSYRIDTYVVSSAPAGGHAVKLVTVVVRNASSLSTTYTRQSSTFDVATGS